MSSPSEQGPASGGASGGSTGPQVTARAATPREEALLEYAAQAIVDSAATVRDFHKTMLGISGTFGTLIVAAGPVLASAVDPEAPTATVTPLPLFMMLTSTVVFALGFLPWYTNLDVNDPDQVGDSLRRLLLVRRWLALVGTLIFIGALTMAGILYL